MPQKGVYRRTLLEVSRENLSHQESCGSDFSAWARGGYGLQEKSATGQILLKNSYFNQTRFYPIKSGFYEIEYIF